MNKLITIEEAINTIEDGAVIMIGGFLGSDLPESLIDAIVKSGVKDLTLIANDTGFTNLGPGKMVAAKQFKKIIVSYIRTNQEAKRQIQAGELEVELLPQEELYQKLLQAGFGQNSNYYADVALLFANKVDRHGNMVAKYTNRNMNNLMALASQTTVVEALEVVEANEFESTIPQTPGIFVDYVVEKVHEGILEKV
ncbi:Acetate CoA-transferase subunit alpha [Jeotgalibaca dankookensis]|uniref:Acetate CoA-transferase subunit alpha n=1 Tax=Jeotgalibaca dankookensis TaxID=708126 RepID=A0A1S6IQG1_9LACT|nr:CoA-transferase [Jeotgalibaca dankookensis]AQS53786.1 Acetate CoA-transferase subunit alpha [Jeotgalibaca dankookensis]